MQTAPQAPKHRDHRTPFDIANDQRKSFKDFKQSLADNPEPEPAPAVAPRTRTGLVESPALTLARQNMEAGKVVAKENAARDARARSFVSDPDVIKGLMVIWLQRHPEYVQCRHNLISFERALREHLYKVDAPPSLAMFDAIFTILKENGYYVDNSPTVRGVSFFNGRPVELYPDFIAPDEQADAQVQAAAPVTRIDRATEDRLARSMSTEELAAIERRRRQERAKSKPKGRV